MKKYIWNILISGDQVINVILGGNPDETLSSRSYRSESNKKLFGIIFRPLIDGLFLFLGQHDHCYMAYIFELERKHLPFNKE